MATLVPMDYIEDVELRTRSDVELEIWQCKKCKTYFGVEEKVVNDTKKMVKSTCFNCGNRLLGE